MFNVAIEKRDNQALVKLARQFQAASMAAATRRAYKSDWAGFLSFCDFREVSPLPASTNTICMFLAELADMGKAVSTIVRSLTSINKAHELAGYDSVRNPDVLATMKGIKRKTGRPANQVKGITYAELIRMLSFCDNTLIGIRDRALLALGWCSALRRSELVALDMGDLEFSDRGIVLTVKRSKTDQEGKGYRLGIPRAAKGACPVAAVHDWIQRLDKSEQAAAKPLFRAVGTPGKRFWYNAVKGRLSARMVSRTVKTYARLCGLPADKYASHSLRRGLATEAGARKIPERIIARHTRHLSTTVLRDYIEAGNIWDENPLASIYTPSSGPISGLE